MSRRKRILVIFGTRPEAIKMAPVIQRLKGRPSDFETLVAVTAQHREMLDQVLGLFYIAPDFDLDIMTAGQSLTDITVRALSGLSPLMERVMPDAVLVQGDTTTTFAAALAAFYHHIPVGHVEAGLRTNNLEHPFPEEANRRLTTKVARWHFAPTSVAAFGECQRLMSNPNSSGVMKLIQISFGGPPIPSTTWCLMPWNLSAGGVAGSRIFLREGPLTSTLTWAGGYQSL